MEASVKERLTGALIFVAAVIVIVPEMFSGPGQPSAGTTQQRAEPGPPLRTVSMTLDDSGEPQVIPAAASAAPSAQVVESPAATQSAVQDPLPAAAAPVEPVAEPASVAAAAQAPAATASAADGSWWLRLGLFGVRANAERLATRLRAAGFAVDMDRQVVGGKDMYRVRAGPVRTRDEALALQARLKASGDESMLLPP